MKGDIHSYVLCTSTFLCDIWEPRFRHNNTVYQTIKIVKFRLILYSYCLCLDSLILQRRLLALNSKMTSVGTF